MLTATKAPSREITRYKEESGILTLYSEQLLTRICVIGDDIFHVTQTVNGSFSDFYRPGIVDNTPNSSISYFADASFITVCGKTVNMVIDRKTSHVKYTDSTGKTVFSENSEERTDFEEYPTYLLSGESAEVDIIQTPDGEKKIIRDAKKEFAGNSYHITWHPLWSDEALYGLGQHEEGYGSLRGKTIYVHQANRKIAIPLLVSTKGYGILIDTYSPMIFNDTADVPYIYSESAPEFDYYFIKGENPHEVIKGYRRLTGKASMLPKWAFGYVQSKERYENETQIKETVMESRKRGIGIDCLVLDWMSWEDGKWGQKTFDKTRFSDAKEMIDTLHKNNTHFMISIWPTASSSTENRKDMEENGAMLKAGDLYNPLKEEGRKTYWKQITEELWPDGVDAFWCDSSEPITPEWSVRTRPEPSNVYREFFKEMGLRISDEYSNSFPFFHALGIYEGQRGQMNEEKKGNPSYKEKRVVNLTRSAYTGSQRLGTVMWSGDIEAKWSTLKKQFGAGLNFCASGIPYWTNDVGAFFVKPGDFWYWNGDYENPTDDLGYKELYTRWYQWAGFLPMFRCHGTDCDREPWIFEGEDNRFYEAMLKANRLRYELMPYIYSEAGKVWLEDASLISPLAFSFPSDEKVYDITDQYMFGSALMVCPVSVPMYFDKNSTPIDRSSYTRKVYLPAGTSWYDFYTKEKYEGGSWVDADAPLDKIPVFVKNKSIIPMTEAALSTNEQNSEITYKVFSDCPCTYTLYTDAGDGYAYETGEYTLKEIKA